MKAAIFGVFFYLLITAGISFSQWIQTNGPDAYEGSVNCITSVGNIVFIGLENYGLYSSSNNGATWKASGINDNSVNALANYNGYLYAGTQFGLFLSSNNGANWYSPADSGLSDPQILSIFCLHDTVFAGTYSGIFVSTNNCSSWLHTLNAASAVNCFTEDFTDNNERWLFAGSDSGIYLSENSGFNWTHLPYQRISISIAAFGPHILSGTSLGIYGSSDYGQSWSPTPVIGHGARSMVRVGYTIYFCGPDGINYTTDFGYSWYPIFTGADIEAMLFDGSNYYAGAYYQDGMFISSNGGENWESSNYGLVPCPVMGLAEIGQTVFAATGGEGVYFTQNSGSYWKPLNNGLVNFNILDIKADGNNLCLANPNGLYTSTDLGLNWVGRGWHGDVIALQGNYIFDGTSAFNNSGNRPKGEQDKPGGIYVSSDFGVTWQLKLLNYSAYCFIENGNNVYTGLWGRVYMTSNYGDNWTNIGTGLPYEPVVSMLMHNGYIFAGTQNNGIYRLNRSDSTWVQSNTGLTDPSVNSLCSEGNMIFAGTNDYVYESTDEGANWSVMLTGIPNNTKINSLIADPYNVFASTSDKGVWKLPAAIIITFLNNHNTELPINFSLYQNYPNPFNPSTKIKFNLPSSASNSSVKLVIYDVLGREVITLINRQLNPGTYEIDWNASDYPSGVYFYKLTAGDFSSVKKMVLEK
jgi:hypothetical protein